MRCLSAPASGLFAAALFASMLQRGAAAPMITCAEQADCILLDITGPVAFGEGACACSDLACNCEGCESSCEYTACITLNQASRIQNGRQGKGRNGRAASRLSYS
jgi:hypothetical protein